jgi:3-mercaptopyruvate sulfurtransferase SseA
LAYEFLHRRGYRNMKVLDEGIPGWQRRGFPVTGRRVGRFEHRPYSPAVLEFERRLGRGLSAG